VVIPGQDGTRGDLARLLKRGGSNCQVQFRGQKLQVDAAGIDRHHDYSPWRNRVTFADIAVDLNVDAGARRFVQDMVRRIDRRRPELEQIARAMTLIHGRLKYDRDYQVVVPEGQGAPRPFGLYLEQGRGVCRQFAVALKLVCDGLDIKCRLERGTLGPTVLPLPLRRKLKQKLGVRMCTRVQELGSLCAGPAARRRGFHVYNEIQLKDGVCYTADPTGKVLAPTNRAVATGLLRPIFDVPWYSYVSTR
jgi:transglutaminase-like putative cysteine protease